MQCVLDKSVSENLLVINWGCEFESRNTLHIMIHLIDAHV